MQNARRGFSHSIPHDNEMLIKQDGNLQKRHYTQTMLHFCNILSFFVDHVSFLLIMSRFFWAITCIFCIFKITIRCCIFLHHVLLLGSWVEFLQFTCIFCIFAVHGRHGTVENFVKNFGVLEGFRTK